MRHYSQTKLKNDFRSSLNVSLLAIPQGMAYALVAGLPIHYGMLSSSLAVFLGAVFGGSRFITLGPTNATSVLLFAFFAGLGFVGIDGQVDKHGLRLLPWIVGLTGMILTLAYVFRLSYMVKFISRTVVTGYITAAACLIIANQTKHIIGIPPPGDHSASSFPGMVKHLFLHIGDLSLPAVAISLSTAIIYIFLNSRFKILPNVALTLVISSLIGVILSTHGWMFSTLSSFESNFVLIDPNSKNLFFDYWQEILWVSVALSLLCLLEGLSIGKSLASRVGDRIDTNKETLSIGLTNIGCSLLTCMPASGSLTRSSLNIQSGASTRNSNIYTGLLVLVGFFLLGKTVEFIPLASLATLVLFIGFSLIKGRQINIVSRSTKSDAITFWVTLSFGLIFSLQIAVFVGVITSILFLLKKVSRPELEEQGYNEHGELEPLSEKTRSIQPEVSIVHVEGVLSFAAADLFYEQMRRVGDSKNIKVLILKLLHAHHLDATSVMVLEELDEYLKEKNCHLLLCELRRDLFKILKNSGLLYRMNRNNIFPYTASNPTLSTAKAIKRAKILIKGLDARVTIYADN